MTNADNSYLIPRASLSDVVYERLRDEIIHGQIPNGTILSQVQLAEKYGVSRIPVREALRRLQAASLVIATPYHPYVVRNVSAAQVLELVDVRAALEDLALSKRGELTAGEVAQLREMNRLMAQKRERAAFLALDRDFHRLLAGPATMTVEILDDVRDKVQRYLSIMAAAKSARSTATEEHASILDAIETGDRGLARQRVRDHVMRSRAFIATLLEGASASTPAGQAAEVGPVEPSQSDERR